MHIEGKQGTAATPWTGQQSIAGCKHPPFPFTFTHRGNLKPPISLCMHVFGMGVKNSTRKRPCICINMKPARWQCCNFIFEQQAYVLCGLCCVYVSFPFNSRLREAKGAFSQYSAPLLHKWPLCCLPIPHYSTLFCCFFQPYYVRLVWDSF